MASQGIAAPALAGAWLGDGLGPSSGAEVGTELVRAWCEEFGAPTVHRYAEVDGDGAMLLAEFPDRHSADGAGSLDLLADADGLVRSFVHGMSNIPDGAAALAETPYLFVVRVFPPREWVEPLRAWLHGEHFERQVCTPGLIWARGYEAVGEPFHFLNIWGIEDPAVPASQEYFEIRATPWFDEVQPAFAASEVRRNIYERVAEGG